MEIKFYGQHDRFILDRRDVRLEACDWDGTVKIYTEHKGGESGKIAVWMNQLPDLIAALEAIHKRNVGYYKNKRVSNLNRK